MPPLSSMKVFTLRSTVASGVALEAGNVYEVSDEDAQILVRLGRATTELPAPKPVRKAKEA
jgi:hypothetical protein